MIKRKGTLLVEILLYRQNLKQNSMKPNLWLYSTTKKTNEIAASLIVFGAEIFIKRKSSKTWIY